MMISNDYKKMFNGIIDNNLTQVHNLDEVAGLQEGPIDDRTRRKLENMYKNLREMINSNLPLRTAEILVLGIGVNLSLATLRQSLEKLQKTVAWYENTLVPEFEELKTMHDNNVDITGVFQEKFSKSIDK